MKLSAGSPHETTGRRESGFDKGGAL